MKMPRIALVVLAVSVLLSGTSCASKTTSDASAAEDTTAAIETTAAAATDATAAPVETTAETTAQVPSEFQVPEGASFIRGYSGYVLISMESVYLLSEQEVTVVDEHVADGISPAAGGEKIILPAGTVAVPLGSPDEITEAAYFEFSPTLTKDSVLILMDGRCVTFDVTEDSDGSLLFNGLKQEDLLGMAGSPVFPNCCMTAATKEEGKLPELGDQDPTVSCNVLTYKTDWNGDGVEDTFCRDRSKGNLEQDGELTITDGASGTTTDITKSCATNDSGNVILTFTDAACFYEDGAGNRMILDTINPCCSYFSTLVYTYDPNTIIAYTMSEGYLRVENDQPYLIRHSFIFGNCDSVIVPASIEDKTLVAQEPGIEIWWLDNRETGTDLSILPPDYTCTYTDFAAEKVSGDTVQPVTIPAGVAVFPLYTITDESGAGVLYFRTVADGVCQANFTADESGNDVMFGGIDQNKLFWCGWGD